MEYRELGRTGLRVSEIGLGCEGFVGKTEEETQALMTQAVEAGVNCMDLYTPDPDLRSRVGRALRGRREQFVLQAHLCTVWQTASTKPRGTSARYGLPLRTCCAVWKQTISTWE